MEITNPESKRNLRKAFLFLILAFYVLNGTLYLQSQSITSDEGSFLLYAARLIHGHPERNHPMTENSKMPISILNLIPRIGQQILNHGLHKSDGGTSDIFAGRYITLAVSLLTILSAYTWSKKLYGEDAGLFTAFLTSFCPNLIANAGLVTSDSYSALFLLLTMFCLWRFLQTPSFRTFLVFAVCIAFSQLVKQSLIFLYLICPLAGLAYQQASPKRLKLKVAVKYGFGFLLIQWFVINAGFLFIGTNTRLVDFYFLSAPFRSLQELLPGWLPIPFPNAFITGLDMAKYYDHLGGGDYYKSGSGNVTILGRSVSFGSFWYYYFVSLFYKTPIPSILFTATGVWFIAKYRSWKQFVTNEFFLVLPILFYILYMSFLYRSQVGIRQIIFIYPLCYILCGSILSHLRTPASRIIIVGLGIYLIVSTLIYWKNYYPYTNEFILNKKMAYRYVGASNLEFHQGGKFFAAYLKQHPEVRMATENPDTGTFLIIPNDYLDIWNLHRYDWLSHIEPSGHVAFDGLLITVTAADLKRTSAK